MAKCSTATKMLYLVANKFPDSEKFGLSAQMKRAVISICPNIAEGSSTKTQKDQSLFYTIAYSSAVELLNQLIICQDVNLIDNETYVEIREKMEVVSI